jgi:hypothetical protein
VVKEDYYSVIRDAGSKLVVVDCYTDWQVHAVNLCRLPACGNARSALLLAAFFYLRYG